MSLEETVGNIEKSDNDVSDNMLNEYFNDADSDYSDEENIDIGSLNVMVNEESPNYVKKHDVFISYAGKNKDLAEKICYVLEINGLKCWIAPRNISSGKNFVDEIADGIKSTKIFVLVFSQFAQKSKYVTNEVIMGFSYKKPIISFNIDETQPNEMLKYYLKVAQWLPAYPNPENHFEKLVKDSLNLCNEESDRPIMTSVEDFTPEDLSKNKKNYISLILLFTPIYWASFMYMGLVSKKKLWTLVGFLYMIPTIIGLLLYFQVFDYLFLFYPIFKLINVIFLIFWALAIIHGFLIRNEFLTRYSVLSLMSLDKDLFNYLYDMYYKI